MKNYLSLLFSCLTGLCVNAQTNIPQKFITSANWVQAKNYYLLTLFEQDKVVSQLLKADPILARLTQKKLNELNTSLTDCKEATCFTDRLRLSDDEIKDVSNELTSLCKPGSALELLVKTQLIPSYTYSLYKVTSPVELLIKAWEQDAAGINYTLDVYLICAAHYRADPWLAANDTI
jgi:hypothetical protein